MIAALSKVAWYDGNSDRVSWETSSQKNGRAKGYRVVGQLVPNNWGLYDMCGNMTEWCRDWYQVDITGLNGALVAERADTSSNTRSVRGGAFRQNGRSVRPGARSSSDATRGTADNWGWVRAGFRLMAPCTAE